MRNNSTPDRKKFLGILMIPQMKINLKTQEEYALCLDKFVDMLKKANTYQYYIENYNLTNSIRNLYMETIRFVYILYMFLKIL